MELRDKEPATRAVHGVNLCNSRPGRGCSNMWGKDNDEQKEVLLV